MCQRSVADGRNAITSSSVRMHQRWSCIGGFLLCRSTQFSKEDNWLCNTISPSRWYTGQLWQSRTSSPAALPPPNLPDLNLLLPSREESWRVDTFKFPILHRVINSLSFSPSLSRSRSRSDRAWLDDTAWCCLVTQQMNISDARLTYILWIFTDKIYEWRLPDAAV